MSEQQEHMPRKDDERINEIDSAPEVTQQAEIPKRRVRMLMVKPEEFMWLFTKGLSFRKQTRIIEGIPEDAQLVAIAADSVRNGVMLVVHSAEYEEIPINVLPPVQVVNIDTGLKNATKKKKHDRKK
jgi:hypothetical protein